MQRQNVKINTKKLNRFLDSLKIRTTEELNAKKKIGQEYMDIEAEYETVKEIATTAVLAKERSRKYRGSSLSLKPPDPSFYHNEDPVPKYVPASKYPLPMSPMPFKPSQKSKNASRLFNLSKLRQHRCYFSTETEKIVNPKHELSFPSLNVEKLDTSIY